MSAKPSTSSSSNGFRPILPTEQTPLLNPHHSHRRSCLPKSFANVFISIVGAGVLGLPYTFMKCGWLSSLLMISAVAALTSHCMLLLVKTRRKIESQSLAPSVPQIHSFGDLGFAVCGPAGKFTVDVMIVLSQAGFCIGYLIFIADTLMNLFNSPGVSDLFTIWGFGAKSVYIWACFPFQLGLNSIPSLTLLAPLSIFADVVEVGSMGVVIFKDFVTFAKHRPHVEAFGTLSSLFYGLGVAVFSFEGTGMALHLESEMIQPEKFGKILCLTMAFTATLYGSFGVLGYLAFGKDTRDIITANMGRGLLSEVVQLGLCVNLFFTFPLMMHPVYEVVERRFSGGGYSFWMRCLLVMVVSLVAVLVPNFADFLSLVGSSICCSLAFVLPALFHYLAFKEEMRWWRGYLDLGIIGFGVVLGITGTWSSLSSILADS